MFQYLAQQVSLRIKIVIPKRPPSACPGDCPKCGAASGHWPTCPDY